MKKAIWFVLVPLVCLAMNISLFAQENISIREYYYPRWSPTGEEIGFVGDFNKTIKTDEETKDLVGYGIAAINLNDLSIRHITPIKWRENGPFGGYSNRRRDSDGEYEKEQLIGDYNANAGTKKQPLVPILSDRATFDWSADGTEVFFYDCPSGYSNDGKEENMYIWAINSDGTNLHPMLKTNYWGLPSYLQRLNNGKIAIVNYQTANHNYNIFNILNSDGKKQSQIPISVRLSSASNENIGLSRDGKKMAIIGNDDKDKNIYIKEVSNSKTIVNLTKAEKVGNCRWPSWSADGKKIVFIFSIQYDGKVNFLTGQEGVWTIDANGKNCRPLTATASNRDDDSFGSIPMGRNSSSPAMDNDSCPSWSPDGNKIVFLRNRTEFGTRNDLHEIWVMNSDGSNQTSLTNKRDMAVKTARK